MDSQLSLFDEPVKRKAGRIYYRDKIGRFATRQQSEMDRLRRDAEYYKLKYEAEYRKNKPILNRLLESERELRQLKGK